MFWIFFLLQKEEVGVKTRYAQNINSMLQYEYSSVYFVCKKPNRPTLDEHNNYTNGSETNGFVSGVQEQEN